MEFKPFFCESSNCISFTRDIVASVGPVAVVWAIDTGFYDYLSGVYYLKGCAQEINHAMIVVGYGTDPLAGDYWLVKNSWGSCKI